MNGVCGTSLQIALRDVTERWQLLWIFCTPFQQSAKETETLNENRPAMISKQSCINARA